MDIEKQVNYWKSGSVDNLETSEILIEKKKYKEGLFFCHLTIEKILKAHFVRYNHNFAPKTHNLLYLVSKTDICIDLEIEKLLIDLTDYQLEGRYPEHHPEMPTREETLMLLKETRELLQWLIQKL
jgi:HEPN domain-containing protein